MRIQIASDLHLEHIAWRFPEYRGVEPCDADVLVLAGDIAKGSRALDLFGSWSCPVVYVPGNHEFYDSSLSDVQSELLRRAGEFSNVTVLAPGVCELFGVRFVGCTLWTDYDLFGAGLRELAMLACGASLPDHVVIRAAADRAFDPAAARTLHLEQRAWLAARLAEPFNGKTVVITHHAPSPLSLHPQYAKDLTSAGFISDLMAMFGQADLHIHGHTHNSFDYEVRGTRVIANPMGYSKGIKRVGTPAELQRENQAFDSQLVIEV
jgi:predicted phosphodiesterase